MRERGREGRRERGEEGESRKREIVLSSSFVLSEKELCDGQSDSSLRAAGPTCICHVCIRTHHVHEG